MYQKQISRASIVGLIFFTLMSFLGCGSSQTPQSSTPPVITPPDPGVPTSVKGFYVREALITDFPSWITQNNLQSNSLLQKGLLDVTLYNGWLDANQLAHPVDPTGTQDSTLALQQAIDDARDFHLVAYFPSGTYLISDTLKGMMRVIPTANGYKNSLRGSVSMLGSSSGSRPLIKLQANAAGFSNLASPKAAVHFWSQCTGNEGNCTANTLNPADEQASVAFNLSFKNIDIDCNGNSAAIGLRMNAAQGSTIENVKVFANGAYAGFYNLPSRVSGAINIAVDGGSYGIINQQGMHPVVIGATLRNQTIAAIKTIGFAPMTVVGFRIIKTNGPVISVPQNNLTNIAAASLNLIDGSIELTNPSLAIDNQILSDASGKDLFLKNVYINNGSPLINSGNHSLTPPNPAQTWSYIKQYAYKDPNLYQETVNGTVFNINKSIIIDGVDSSSPYVSVGPASVIPLDLISRHLPQLNIDPASAQAKNVRDADIGAWGDGLHDDTAALQAAIDQFDQVLLPKGTYRLTAPLRLHANTKLLGIRKTYTELFVDTDYWCPTTNTPIVITDNDPIAASSISDLQITIPVNDAACEVFTALKWQAGNRSMVKDISLKNSVYTNRSNTKDRQLVQITNAGGGRWYFLNAGDTYATKHPNYRVLKVFDNQNTPLSFYGLNAEHSQGDSLIEFNNTGNIAVYGIKAELTHVATGIIPNFDFMHIINSNNIEIFGHAAAGAHEAQTALYRIIDSNQIMLTNILPKTSHNQLVNLGDNIVEVNNGVTTAIANGQNLVTLYKKGYAIAKHAYNNSYTYCHAPNGQPLELDLKRLPADSFPNANPTVVFIHGGGWRIGSRKTDQLELFQQSASQGYVAVSLDYRLTSTSQSNNNPLRFQPENSYSTGDIFPAQIYDVKCAIKWLKTNASRFNIDPNRIGVVGASAGGHLTSLLATSGGIGSFGSNPLKPLEYDSFNLDASIAAAVNWFGPSALYEAYINPPNAVGIQQTGICLLYGNTLCLDPNFNPQADPQFQSLVDNADPLNYLLVNAANIANMPAIQTIIGDQDEVVAQSSVSLFNNSANQAGMTSSLIIYPNVKHSFKPTAGNTLTRNQILNQLAYPDTYSFLQINL